MNTQDFLTYGWQADPFALALGAALPMAYGFAFGFTSGRQVALMASAVGIILLALVSPIGVLAQTYLFTAHMFQHLVLLLVAPAFLVLSLPDEDEKAGPPLFVPGLAWLLKPAPISWLAGVGGMWLWHTPFLCNAAGISQSFRHLQTLSLLMMGLVFWWPVLGPNRPSRLAPLAGITYLFSACLACTLLGIYITFTPLEVCSIYHHPVDPYQILPLIRNRWGLTPSLDQQIGGLMMWVPACLIYLAGIIGLLARWYGKTESHAAEAAQATQEPVATFPARQKTT